MFHVADSRYQTTDIEDVVHRIHNYLDTAVVKDLHNNDPTLMTGLANFLQLIVEGVLDPSFLPFLTFVDAAHKQSSKAGGFRPPVPHRDTSIYFGEKILHK